MASPPSRRRIAPAWTGFAIAAACVLVAVGLLGRRADEVTLREANVAGSAGQLGRARQLAQALTDGTTAADAWGVRAQVATLQRRFPSAVTALRRELALRPNDWQARRELAQALQATGQAAEARREYARAKALNPRQEPLFPFDIPDSSR